MDNNNNDKIRLAVASIFLAIYDLAQQCGASREVFRRHEVAITLALLEARRRRRVRPVPD